MKFNGKKITYVKDNSTIPPVSNLKKLGSNTILVLLKNGKKSLQNSQFMHNKINFGYTGCFYGSVAVRRSA